MTRPQPVSVIGGGVAGLVVAHDLARAGLAVRVLEAADRLGGQLDASVLAGQDADLGAESFATRGSAVAELIADLGLTERVELPTSDPAWVYHGPGDAHPLPATAVLGIPANPFAADVRRALGTRAAMRAGLDAVLPKGSVSAQDTLGRVVARRMGPAVVTRLVNPVVRGVFSGDADSLPLATVSPPLAGELTTTRRLALAARRVRAASPAGSQVARLRGGMVSLVEALARAAAAGGAELRTGVWVQDVASIGGPVVVAAPGLASPVQSQRVVTVVAASVTGVRGAPRGSGVLVAAPPAPGRARALTHISAKWPSMMVPDGEAHLVRLSYDGPTAPSREDVQRDVRELTGVSGAVVHEIATRTWRRTVKVAPVPPDVLVVGEASGRSGLASIVPHARQIAASLVSRNA